MATTPSEGDYRIVVPIFNSGLSRDGYAVPGRTSIGKNVVIAALDDKEMRRVQESTLETWGPYYRIEVYGFSEEPANAVAIINHYFRLLSLTVRMSPRHYGIVTDRFDGHYWIRANSYWLGRSVVGASETYSYLPLDRMTTTWPRLMDAWPVNPSKANQSIYRALDFYYDSVTERRDRSSIKSLLTSSVAFELLLGPGMRDELRYRMSTRGAVLVATGDEAKHISRWLGKYYDARSKLVHAGSEPSDDLVDQIHQYLMRALPSMLKLSQVAGSHSGAAAMLDAVAFGEVAEVAAVLEPGWWSYVTSDWLAARLK